MSQRRTHRVVFRAPDGREVAVSVAEDEYLLFAARAAGLPLESMCLQGWCTTCAGRVVEGEVDQSEAFRLYPEDEEGGFVLLCSAYPCSDLVILVDQKHAMREHRRRHGRAAPRG